MQKDQVPTSSIDTQPSETRAKEEDEGVALLPSLGLNNESTRSINQMEYSSPDNLISGYASETESHTPTSGVDGDAQGKVKKVGFHEVGISHSKMRLDVGCLFDVDSSNLGNPFSVEGTNTGVGSRQRLLEYVMLSFVVDWVETQIVPR